MTHRILALVLAVLACACGSPTAPRASAADTTSPTPTSPTAPASPSPTTPPLSPSSTRFTVRGTVRDTNGVPLAGVTVEVQYGAATTGVASNPPSTCPFLNFCWLAAKTDSSGAYEAVFDARQATVFGMPGIAATINAIHPSYASNLQIVPFTQADVVQNFWIEKAPVISAGQGTTVTIDSDSSRCNDGEDLFVLTSRCEAVGVDVSNRGTLVVEARAQGGGIAPTVYWATTGNYEDIPSRTGSGIVAFQVRPGHFTIFVGVPAGTSTQRVDVITTFR